MRAVASMNRLLAVVYDWSLCQLCFTGDFSRFTFDEHHVNLLAVAIKRTSPCTAHAGVAYRSPAGVLRFLHFGNHHEAIRDDVCSGQNAFAIPLLKEEDLKFLAGFCGRVYHDPNPTTCWRVTGFAMQGSIARKSSRLQGNFRFCKEIPWC